MFFHDVWQNTQQSYIQIGVKSFIILKRYLKKNGVMTVPGLTYVSVGHRPSLVAYHDKRLRLNGEDHHSFEDIEKSALSSQELLKKASNLICAVFRIWTGEFKQRLILDLHTAQIQHTGAFVFQKFDFFRIF